MKSILAALLSAALGICANQASATSLSYEVRGITNATFSDYQAGWNAQSSGIVTSAPSNFTNIAGGNNSYDHLTVNFNMLASGHTLNFQLAPDAGFGGAAYLDGQLLSANNVDLWWGYNWGNTSQLINVSLSNLSSGTHTLEFFWAEGCCNGNQSARFNLNGGAWQELSVSNLNNASQVPEPASLALLGLGLTGLTLARRRKA